MVRPREVWKIATRTGAADRGENETRRPCLRGFAEAERNTALAAHAVGPFDEPPAPLPPAPLAPDALAKWYVYAPRP